MCFDMSSASTTLQSHHPLHLETELKSMVALVSRTGRHLQRYNKGCRVVVGCIPYRYKVPNTNRKSFVDEDSLEVLVISAQRKGKGMLFPKGGWEIDETLEAAAQRETIEEAGVVGDKLMPLGRWTSDSQTKENYMFGLLVKEQLEFWPEKDKRQRIWMSVQEARKECKQQWMKDALEKLIKVLTNEDPFIKVLANEANLASSCSTAQDWRRNL